MTMACNAARWRRMGGYYIAFLILMIGSSASAFSLSSLLSPSLPKGPAPTGGFKCARPAFGAAVGRRPGMKALDLAMQATQGAVGSRPVMSADTNPVYGETGGAMLLMEDVTVSRGDRDLMSGVNWRLMPSERVGLVGANGAGKSTLLSAAAGRIPVMGKVLVKNGLSMGYLVQTAVSGSKKSCWEEASSQMHRLNKAQLALDQVTQRIVDGDTSEETLNEQAEALTAFEAAGGYNVDEKVASVLSGLGFAKEDYEKSCTEFSGGWQMKIALARLLLSEPEMLLLDEPTNHLDAKAKAWLGRYISSYDGTVVIVTHEEALLESARLTQVIEVRDQQAHMFRGSYDKFLEERVARVERAQKEYEEQQREIEKLESYITRFGAKMSHAASAQSKKKALDRIERVQAPTDLEIVEDRAKLRFPRPQTCERDMITLKGATWGWNNQALYKDANIVIERGMRLVILGPNGCGKSTLLAALSGRLPLMAGSRSLAESLEMGVFTQDLAQDLDMDAVALDVVLEHVRHKDATITNERARAVMGALGLTGSKALQKIGTMSGGEKARVALSMFVLVPHNLLILDEPSNHLDMSTVQVLTEALQEYQGTIVVVTHNRPFCELLAPTHVATVLGSPGSQTVKIEERPLRASDWEGMEDAGSASGVPGASSRTMDRKMGTTTLSKKKGGGSATLKKGKNAVVEEEAPQRELFPWEMDGAMETGLKQNKQGKLVSVEKKLTPQQKKLEKMKNKAANDDEPQFKDKFEFQGKGGNGKAAKGKAGKGKGKGKK